MNRLLFEKTGKAIYISHLDTMALFPRVFLRAGLHIKFTQGMSPHAYVSVALPLSVGMSSRCEILDFTLEEEDVPLESLPERLNPYFPAGIRVLSAYDSSRKIKELRYLQCNVRLEYDGGAGDEVRDTLNALFQRKEIFVEKRSKKGMTEVDIGLVPGWGGAIRLPRRTNLIRAKEMLLLGTRLRADEAMRQGIINRVFPKDELFDEVDKIMDVIVRKPPLAVQGIKEIISLGALDTGFEDAREIEHRLSIRLMGSHDFREAVDAFRNKREPHFIGK